MNREFLMLAKSGDVDNFLGVLGSEKLNGTRAFWDGGVTRGLPKGQIPWANNVNSKYVRVDELCTGLWSRYGNVIHAPDWWLDGLPRHVCIDGELWERGLSWEDIRTLTSGLSPLFTGVRLHVFAMPSYEQFIQGGRINNPNFQRMLSYADCAMFLMERNIPLGHVDLTMDGEQYLLKQLPPGPSWTIHTQMPVTPQNFKTWYDGIIERGGEGVVVREKYSSWAPRRLSCVIKYKAENDTEGTVIGYQAGKGKHQGRLGSLLIRCEDLPGQPVLSLSGFSDDERYLDSAEAIDWASQHPGAEMPFDCSRFPRGTKVTFKYRGLSAAGVPLEARYWRKYHE